MPENDSEYVIESREHLMNNIANPQEQISNIIESPSHQLIVDSEIVSDSEICQIVVFGFVENFSTAYRSTSLAQPGIIFKI